MSLATTQTVRKLRPPARALACEILTAAQTGSSYLDQILEERLAASQLPAKDRALVTALANGTTRMRARLDAEIAAHYRGNYAAARPQLKNILRTALFQMRCMDRIPAYAAINEAVEMARAKFGEAPARLCNAVLRQAQRSPFSWPEAAVLLERGDLKTLSACLSLPEWLIRCWLHEFGREETLALAEACNQIPAMMVRVIQPERNTNLLLQELARLNQNAQPVEEMAGFFRLPHLDQISGLEIFRAGLCTIQDASTGLIAPLAAPSPGETVIDLCAAPGGKALHLAELAHPGQVIAVDKNLKRLELLEQAAARLKFSIHVIAGDARNFSAAPADIVLVDAPCSGLGVLSRRSDLRWRRRPEEIPELAALQKEILVNAARLVRAGGRLIYSTCTITPEENDEIVAWFLEQYPHFTLQPATQFLPRRFCDERGFVRTFPHRHEMDGSFAACLKRLN